jgi:uncharacterized membrane protein
VITCEFDAASAGGRIVLRPNHSCSWRANVCLAGTLVAVSGTIGSILALRGLWPILPFAVAEGLVVLASLYWCTRRSHMQEVLTFSPDYLLYERGVRRPGTRCQFQRYFTRFLVQPASHPWYRQRIALRCRDQELEIGSFLTSEEQEDLVRVLRDMIQRLDGAPSASPLRQ